MSRIEGQVFSAFLRMFLLEKGNLIAALQATDWQISGRNGAAQLLGLKPSTLAYRMKQFGLDRRGREN